MSSLPPQSFSNPAGEPSSYHVSPRLPLQRTEQGRPSGRNPGLPAPPSIPAIRAPTAQNRRSGGSGRPGSQRLAPTPKPRNRSRSYTDGGEMPTHRRRPDVFRRNDNPYWAAGPHWSMRWLALSGPRSWNPIQIFRSGKAHLPLLLASTRSGCPVPKLFGVYESTLGLGSCRDPGYSHLPPQTRPNTLQTMPLEHNLTNALFYSTNPPTTNTPRSQRWSPPLISSPYPQDTPRTPPPGSSLPWHVPPSPSSSCTPPSSPCTRARRRPGCGWPGAPRWWSC